jgi:hypothetical protein
MNIVIANLEASAVLFTFIINVFFGPILRRVIEPELIDVILDIMVFCLVDVSQMLYVKKISRMVLH